jgi:putative heme degradation protein
MAVIQLFQRVQVPKSAAHLRSSSIIAAYNDLLVSSADPLSATNPVDELEEVQTPAAAQRTSNVADLEEILKERDACGVSAAVSLKIRRYFTT